MKIAVAYEYGKVFPHFGRSNQFKVYEIKDGAVERSAVVVTGGRGHGALGEFLKGQGVDTVICGGIGTGAQAALADAGIQLYGGVEGDADGAVADLLAGRLRWHPNIQCGHAGGHRHGDSCEGR